METTFHLGNPVGLEFDQLIDIMSDKEFMNLTRSTIPLLDYWRKPEERVKHLGDGLSLDLSPAKICFEYPVQSISKATASYTDIMIDTKDVAIAIEGKWTEPQYETVKTWKKKTKRHDEVLNHWLRFINPKLNSSNSLIDNITYQLLHRTASACSLRKVKTLVIYQVFYEQECPIHYGNDMNSLKKLVEDYADVSFNVAPIRICKSDAYTKLIDLLPRGVADKSQFVRQALKKGGLFSHRNDPIRVV